jgi:hypothetical protein
MHIVALEDLGHTFDVIVVDCKDWGFRILFLWSLENTCCHDNWTSPGYQYSYLSRKHDHVVLGTLFEDVDEGSSNIACASCDCDGDHGESKIG